MIGYNEGFKIGLSDGDVGEIKLGVDEGSELVSSYGSLDGHLG